MALHHAAWVAKARREVAALDDECITLPSETPKRVAAAASIPVHRRFGVDVRRIRTLSASQRVHHAPAGRGRTGRWVDSACLVRAPAGAREVVAVCRDARASYARRALTFVFNRAPHRRARHSPTPESPPLCVGETPGPGPGVAARGQPASEPHAQVKSGRSVREPDNPVPDPDP